MLRNIMGPCIHIGLPVLDIVKVKEWYRDILCFEIIHEPLLKVEGTAVHVSFMKKGELELEFYELTKDEKRDYANRRRGVIDHIAIKVSDVEKTTAFLTKNGARTVDNIEGLVEKKLKYQMLRGIFGEKLLITETNDPVFQDFELAHIGVAYSDKDKTISFYKRFGFELLNSTVDPSILSLQYSNIIMKFIPVSEADMSQLGDGYIDHVAFDVKDIDDAYRRVKMAGMLVIEDAPIELPFWEKGIKYFNFRGPGNEKLELEQKIK